MATLLLVSLLLSLSSICTRAGVSWNIDCGSSVRSYTDSNGMIWIGDSALIKSGKSKTVPSSNSFDHVQDTLRVFSSGKKNCYSLKAEKGAKVLMQPYFYYGNYDGKSAAPTFDVEIDGNDWITVNTSGSDLLYFELVYAVGGDSISVCLVQTYPDQFPFISSLRIQSLPSGMYNALDSKHAMFSYARYAFGSDKSISYPSDVYGRSWDSIDLPKSEFTPVTNKASRIDTSAVKDDIPEAVMKNAITASSSSENGTLILSPLGLPTSPMPAYITMYFTEVAQLNSPGRRSFSVYVDDEPMESTEAFSPTYGSAKELSIYNVTVSEDTTFMLLPNSDSTLPPVISAMEIYEIVDFVPSSDPADRPEISSPSSLSKPPVVPVACLLIYLVLINCLSGHGRTLLLHGTTME